jgi:2-phosphoglycerate kinase
LTSRDDAPWLDEPHAFTLVGDEPDAPPFMPGILVHSLLQRGVPFATAYTTARAVEQRLESAVRVQRNELAALLREVLGYDPGVHDGAGEHEIQVAGGGTHLPFSKGILSQSLLAAAIDPRQAFEVAREIERELIGANLRKIDRAALRSLAHRVLRKRSGHHAAKRYLVWRRYQEPEKPVFLLLGGSSGVGKTTLALEVARRLGIGRVLSTDSIRQVMRLMISADLVPSIHASSYDAHVLLSRETGTEVSVLEGFRAQASSVAVGVRASLDRGVEESANLVVDGVSLLPGVIDLDRYAGRAHVVFCVVATLDESALRNRFQIRASGQKQRLPHRYLENIDGIVAIQRHLIGEAKRRDMLVVDNIDLDASAREVLAHVLDRLETGVEADARRS